MGVTGAAGVGVMGDEAGVSIFWHLIWEGSLGDGFGSWEGERRWRFLLGA